MDQSKMTVFKLMDCVDLVEEELVEGMQPEAEESSTQSETEEAPEMDEHVWTAPANAMRRSHMRRLTSSHPAENR